MNCTSSVNSESRGFAWLGQVTESRTGFMFQCGGNSEAGHLFAELMLQQHARIAQASWVIGRCRWKNLQDILYAFTGSGRAERQRLFAPILTIG